MSSKRSRKVLSIEKKIEIVNRLEKGEPGSSLAKVYYVSKTTISELKVEMKSFCNSLLNLIVKMVRKNEKL